MTMPNDMPDRGTPLLASTTNFYVPRWSEEEAAERPYDICARCDHYDSHLCDGPNFLAMTPSRRCEWLQLRKGVLHQREPSKWSYKYIADLALCAEATVMRIFTDEDYDPRVSTLAAIFRCLGGSWGKYPCALLAMSEQPAPVGDAAALVQQIAEKDEIIAKKDALIAELQAKLDREEAESRVKIDFLTDQVRRKDQQIEKLLDRIH